MTDFRIIYVPGMKPKPAPDVHRRELLRALGFGLRGVRPEAADLLREHEERFELVSWTYAFHGSHRDIALDLPGLQALYEAPEPSESDRSHIDSWRRRLARWRHLVGDFVPILRRFLADVELRETLAEVRRYQRNEEGVASRLRGMVKTRLIEAWTRSERVLLIGHSLGSVICYDSLWELSRESNAAGRVDLFITLGSPLATRLIRNSLSGADRSGPERFPANIRRWMNFSARGELTALPPRLKPVFGGIVAAGLTEFLEDRTDLYNHFRGDSGINVHKSYGYLANGAVAGRIGDWLLE